MGTNYYAKLHIGKQSAGWRFLWHSIYDERLTSRGAWERFLESCTIEDEYGHEINLSKFLDDVDAHQKLQDPADGSRDTDSHDRQGNSFSSEEFS